MAVQVTSAVLEGIVSQARLAAPHECCGILLGAEGRVDAFRPAANVHPDPARHFEIDPRVLIAAHRDARAGGARIAGYYHSHPNGRCEPSATDRAQSARDGRLWAIVAAGDVTFWRDGETGFEPLSYRRIDA